MRPLLATRTAVQLEDFVPKRESRESIQAELNADLQARLLRRLDEAKRELIELDEQLMRAESRIGDPVQWRDDPVAGRMRRVGVPPEAIANYERLVRWLVAMKSGDPLPLDLLKAAEVNRTTTVNVADQLAKIVQASKRNY
jgi:hypothetical protein